MSIASAITDAQQRVANAYTAVSNKGGTLPVTQNLTNLPNAITSIPSGGSSPVIEALNITPTTSEQTHTASGGVDGYSPVTVAAVDSNIDPNILSNNIKKDVVILGITGTYEGSGGETRFGADVTTLLGTVSETSPVGFYLNPTGNPKNITFTGLIGVNNDGLQYKFWRSKNVGTVSFPDFTTPTSYGLNNTFAYSSVSSISFPSLTTVSYSLTDAFAEMCRNATGLNSISFANLVSDDGFYNFLSLASGSSVVTVDFGKLETVSGAYNFHSAFNGCTSLTTINFSSLKTVSAAQAFYNAFRTTSITGTLDLSSLETVTGSQAFYEAFAYPYTFNALTGVNFSSLTSVTGSGAFQYMFAQCIGLTTVTFPVLTEVLSTAFQYMFYDCTGLTELSFPALTTAYNTSFANMLLECSDVTVHFPAAMEATMQNWSSVTNGFGGTNTTVLFDLTATS